MVDRAEKPGLKVAASPRAGVHPVYQFLELRMKNNSMFGWPASVSATKFAALCLFLRYSVCRSSG